MKGKDNGTKKAAILLISLGPEVSSQVLRMLPDRMIQKVTCEIANIKQVEPKEREKVMQDFMDMASASEYILDGGIDYARDLLTKALGNSRANEVLQEMDNAQQKEMPFSVLRKADTSQLASMLINEHPQTIALIMCYIQPDKAAEVLSMFPNVLQAEIAERIGVINRAAPEVIKKIETILQDKFKDISESDNESIGGVKKLVEILNSVDRDTEKNILSDLEKTQPELVEIIKASLFVFEDIISLDKSSIQRVLREVPNEDLVLSLKGASEEVTSIVYANLSKRASETIKEDMEFLGPVRLKTVEEAQHRIVGIIRRLEEAGEIVISRGDSDSFVI
jgi:flagellar motor switch protein FliG